MATIHHANLIDTSIGTLGDCQDESFHGGGKTYPGAAYPFGMVQFSPDTNTGGDNGAGYSYHHKTIEGFSINHLSGIGWYGDLGNLQFMPTNGPVKVLSGTNKYALTQLEGRGYESDFRHETEKTEAGYYAVMLDTYRIFTELTCSQHCGMMRVTFPSTGEQRIQINLARRIGGRSAYQKVSLLDRNGMEGVIECPSTLGGFGRGGGHIDYKLFYSVHFSRPFVQQRAYDRAKALPAAAEYAGEELCFTAEVEKAEEPLLIRIGISYFSLENARENLKNEILHESFDSVREKNLLAWEQELNVRVSGSDDTRKKIFYTCLYHTFLDPRVFADANGESKNGKDEIVRDPGFTRRTVFSGWDVYRSEFPFLTIAKPNVVNDVIRSLMDVAEKNNGTFPRWELLGLDSHCMIGDPGIIITADAYRKGIRNYDAEKAFQIACNAVCQPTGHNPGRQAMAKYGYVPGKISETLENAFADNCLYVLAKEMGKTEFLAEIEKRLGGYKQIFDPAVGWMNRRNEDGSFAPFESEYDTKGCMESNIFQQTWFVPQDPQWLLSQKGKEKALGELERLFSEADFTRLWNDAYNQSNEPCHTVAPLFTEAGMPHRTQYWVREVQNGAYRLGPAGFCGNEDVGQMSAWYVLSALGMVVLAPASNIYYLTTPLFRSAEVSLSKQYHTCANRDSFRVETDLDPERYRYIKTVYLNGKELNRAWITFAEISAGGVLRFCLDDTPHPEFGTELPNRPFGG